MAGCPHCADMKNMLHDKGIHFTERDCDEYEYQYDILLNNTGIDYVPAFEIRNDVAMTKIFIVPERDFNTLEEALEKVSRY